jgi:hypothetical protein
MANFSCDLGGERIVFTGFWSEKFMVLMVINFLSSFYRMLLKKVGFYFIIIFSVIKQCEMFMKSLLWLLWESVFFSIKNREQAVRLLVKKAILKFLSM